MTIKNARGKSRNDLVTFWFNRFVNGLAYEQTEFHDFCKDVKSMTPREIEKYYNQLC